MLQVPYLGAATSLVISGPYGAAALSMAFGSMV